MKPYKYRSLSHMWLEFVPEYRSTHYAPFHVTFPWSRRYVDFVEEISIRRCARRIDSYIIPGELERSQGAVRFGNKKTGRGYQNKRGEFCLLAGHLSKSGHLTVFYRNLELIGGLHFDLPVYAALENHLGKIRRLSIFAVEAFVFGVRGRQSLNKEKLYDQVRTRHLEVVS